MNIQKGSTEESFAVEAGSSDVKIAAKGGGAGRLSEALADLISPFSNLMGILGDQLQHARNAAAYRAAKKGVEMLDREGIRAGNIPPKILLPWLEGASLESEKDEILEDAWAGLFARAVKSSDATIISYIEVLRRIGVKEAELLRFFATDTSPFFSQRFFDPRFFGGLNSPNLMPEKALEAFDRSTPAQLREHMEHFGLQSMCQVIYYSVNDSSIYTTKYFEENEQVVSNLEHLGLININLRTFSGEKRQYTIYWFEITKFAFDMFWACQGELTGMQNTKFRAKAT
jgi:hypothetical protein